MVLTVLLSIGALAACGTVQCQSPLTSVAPVWTQASVRCVPDDAPAAIGRWDSLGVIHCMQEASKGRTGALVAQFNSLTRSCIVFNYQSVCRQLSTGASPNCEVFFRFPIDHRSISPKLSNLWIASSVSRLENLVCQAAEDINRLYPAAVQWTSDGAVFDGTSSYAVLNKTSISFLTGLTWLLRIKRQPRVQPIADFIDCSTLGSSQMYAVHIWEYGEARQLYARTGSVTGSVLPKRVSSTNQLSASSEDWLNIGFTTTASGDSADFFLGSAFLPRSTITSSPDPNTLPAVNQVCMLFGMRLPSEYFSGTLAAFGLASSAMSEAEIREFFASIA